MTCSAQNDLLDHVIIPVSDLDRSIAFYSAAHAAALAASGRDKGAPGARLHYDPRYYAGNVFDPDGYGIEFVDKGWQHPQR